MKKVSLAIHGGAGALSENLRDSENSRPFREVLEGALARGFELLQSGASALDVVEEAVKILEDAPLFNAGVGSVLNSRGQVEMDAAIMCGLSRRAGAVGAVQSVKNPVSLARKILEISPHVLICGPAAIEFAAKLNLELKELEYFITSRRQVALERAKEIGVISLEHDSEQAEQTGEDDGSKGTVGAVALDQAGHTAAATSTGGMTNKSPGRVGDSPVPGAGTYAEKGVCAVSATGDGEFFLLGVAAHDIAARIKYGGLSLGRACEATLDNIKTLGGRGGVIALSESGEIYTGFNTRGMFRGSVGAGLEPKIELF